MPIICSVSWKRRALPRSVAISAIVFASRSVDHRTELVDLLGVHDVGTLLGDDPAEDVEVPRLAEATAVPGQLGAQGGAPGRIEDQAEGAQVGAVRRMATRLWWMRSVSVWRRSVPSSDSRADWAQSGRVPILVVRASRVPVRLSSSTSSSPMSLSRKVRADMARTRWRTIPAVGSGKCSGAVSSPRVPAVPNGDVSPLPVADSVVIQKPPTSQVTGARSPLSPWRDGRAAPSIAWADAGGDDRRGDPRVA